MLEKGVADDDRVTRAGGGRDTPTPGSGGARALPPSRAILGIALVGIVLLGFAVRSLGLEDVFAAPGEVVLRSDDAQYHARLAQYSVAHFPRVLTWDPYLNHPHGERVPWPGFYDLGLAAAALVLGGSGRALDLVLAWAPAALGSLTVLAVYALGRAVVSPAAALGAAAIFAMLPASAAFSAVGNPDHHAAVSLLGALLVAAYLWGVHPEVRGRRLVAVHAALAGVRALLVLTWAGNLLYLGIGEPSWIAVAVLAGRRDAVVRYAVGALASALLVAAWIAFAARDTAPFSGAELSWLHVAALLAFAGFAAISAGWERARPTAGARPRALRLCALALVAGAIASAVPSLRDGAALGLSFFSEESRFIAGNYENVSIFQEGSARVAHWLFGLFAYAIPVAPLVLLWRARDSRVRAPALVLALWTAALGGLAIAFVRFGNDFAPAGAVCLAGTASLLATGVARLVRLPERLVPGLAVLIGIGALAPSFPRTADAAVRAATFLRSGPGAISAPVHFHRDLHRFARRVREATPETAGYLDPSETPEYGILCFPAVGHAIVGVAHRPATATNFGPSSFFGIDARLDSYGPTNRYYALRSEERALEVAKRLRVRYLVTSREGRPPKTTLLHRLHGTDGAGGAGVPRLEHFRLVTEWPAYGVALGWLSGNAPLVTPAPFKLFEIVAGAVLEVRGAPGSEATAEVEIETVTGRRFFYRAAARIGPEGVAHLRVPYATSPADTSPRGPYRVTSGERAVAVAVSEADVREGRIVRVRSSRDPTTR
ncbi:MAG: STT3 domain-containing protein [Myxococcota bacterium]